MKNLQRSLVLVALVSLMTGISVPVVYAESLTAENAHWDDMDTCDGGVLYSNGLLGAGNPENFHAMNRSIYDFSDAGNVDDRFVRTRDHVTGQSDGTAGLYFCQIDIDGYFEPGNGIAGYARINFSYRNSGYHITAGSVMLNTAYTDNYGEFQRDVVNTHEIGHTHGLGHNDRCTSVMAYCYGNNWFDSGDLATLSDFYVHNH